MRVRTSPVLRTLPVLFAGAVLAACGSSGATTNAASSSQPGSTVAASTPAASTPESSPSSESPAAVSGGDFCQEIVAQKAQLTTNEMPKLLQSGTPAGWKAYLAATAAMNDRLYAAAPDALKATVDELRSANKALAQTLEAAGYDMRKVKMTALLAAISSAQFKKASADLTAYVKDTCSIDLSKP